MYLLHFCFLIQANCFVALRWVNLWMCLKRFNFVVMACPSRSITCYTCGVYFITGNIIIWSLFCSMSNIFLLWNFDWFKHKLSKFNLWFRRKLDVINFKTFLLRCRFAKSDYRYRFTQFKTYWKIARLNVESICCMKTWFRSRSFPVDLNQWLARWKSPYNRIPIKVYI